MKLNVFIWPSWKKEGIKNLSCESNGTNVRVFCLAVKGYLKQAKQPRAQTARRGVVCRLFHVDFVFAEQVVCGESCGNPALPKQGSRQPPEWFHLQVG